MTLRYSIIGILPLSTFDRFCQHHHFLAERITAKKKTSPALCSAFKLTWFISGTSSSWRGNTNHPAGSGSKDDNESGFAMGHEKRVMNESSILKAPFRVMVFGKNYPKKREPPDLHGATCCPLAMDYGNWSDYVIAFCGHSESVQGVDLAQTLVQLKLIISLVHTDDILWLRLY